MINPCENVNGHRNETTCVYALTNIHPMENHPFKVKDDEDMAALVESIDLSRKSITLMSSDQAPWLAK